MAIVAFWSDEKKETGQTLSMVALATHMAIEHNYKILEISTNFKDNTLEDCYWNSKKEKDVIKGITDARSGVGMESGVEGLIKMIRSNRTTKGLVPNYTRAVFNSRLDVLCSPKTTKYEEYLPIAKLYPEIMKIADQDYDLVLVDISKRMDTAEVNRILETADVVVVNITQRLTIIDKYYKLKEKNTFFQKNNILLNIGRYDAFSKYNIKNISRYLKMKRDILAIPYNTLYFESCSEGKAADYFLKLRNLDQEDRNYLFINEISKFGNELIFKLEELQIKP